MGKSIVQNPHKCDKKIKKHLTNPHYSDYSKDMIRSSEESKNIKIPNETHQRLKVISSVRGEKLQDVVDQALRDWMKQQETPTSPDQAADLRKMMEGNP